MSRKSWSRSQRLVWLGRSCLCWGSLGLRRLEGGGSWLVSCLLGGCTVLTNKYDTKNRQHVLLI